MSNRAQRRTAPRSKKAAPEGPPTSTSVAEPLDYRQIWHDAIDVALDPTRRTTDRLTAARQLELSVRSGLLDTVVKAAREEGWSWAEIGSVFGVTRQAARTRFLVVEGPA